MEQQIWSRQAKTNGTVARQLNNVKTTGLLVETKATIVAARQNGATIECLIEPDRSLPSTKGIWFPLQITAAEFSSQFGSIDSFNSLYEKPDCSFCYRSPNISTGRIYVNGQKTIDLETETKTVSTSLSEVILGFSESSYKNEKVNKAIGSDNTAIKLQDNKIRINTSNGFMEASDKGLSFGGPINFQSLPSENTFGMVLKMQNPFLGMLPSTAVTPVPQYTFKLPIEQIKAATLLLSIAMSFI